MPEIWEEKIPTVSRPKPHLVAGERLLQKKALHRKRFHDEEDTREAVLVLDAGGTIQDLSPAARRLLGYHSDQPFKPSFFSHVHAQDLYRVMRDVAEMTFHGRQEAAWELRLRTGSGHWGWFNARVGNHLGQPEHAISIHLKAPEA